MDILISVLPVIGIVWTIYPSPISHLLVVTLLGLGSLLWILPDSALINAVIFFLVIFAQQLLLTKELNRATLVGSFALINMTISQTLYDFILNQRLFLIPETNLKLIGLTVMILIYFVLNILERKLVTYLEMRYPLRAEYLFIPAFIISVLLQGHHLFLDYIQIAFQGIVTFKYLVILLCILATIFLIIIYFAHRNQSQVRVLNELRAQDQIQMEYAKMIEEQYREMRKFRHDYKNTMLILDNFIEKQDWQGIQAFYQDELKPLTLSNHSYQEQIQINRLRNASLQNLINVKLTLAKEEQIQVSVEIPEPIEIQMIEQLPLIRILGILLDNAIEGALTHSKPVIHLAIMKIDAYEVIIIKNNFIGKIDDLNLIRQEGYSTKGENRGLGLAIVDQIIKNHSLDLRTHIEGDYFTQELIIHEEV